MKITCFHPTPTKGVTLVEMSIVIMILLALMGGGMMVFGGVDDWKKGRAASETLRSVYSAQRMFLADHPTRLVSSLTAAEILEYMPNNPTSMPTVKSITGQTLSIKVNVSPPVVNDGNGNAYDPSGKSNDSIWDVGE